MGAQKLSLFSGFAIVKFVKIKKLNSQTAQNFILNFVQFFVSVLIDRKQKNQ